MFGCQLNSLRYGRIRRNGFGRFAESISRNFVFWFRVYDNYWVLAEFHYSMFLGGTVDVGCRLSFPARKNVELFKLKDSNSVKLNNYISIASCEVIIVSGSNHQNGD
jgi:hypothetical protein